MTQQFRFPSGTLLRLGGPAPIERHFVKEYGDSAITPGGNVDVDLTFGPVTGGHFPSRVVEGRHKSVGWTVALSSPQARPVTASIEMRGRPRFFVASLVQGFFVEPLLSLAAARDGHVLLPSAAIREDDGALLLIGASRSGKSSLAARAIAVERPVLGDDQVFLDEHGICRAFPRRMRFYSDLPLVAPGAYARLPGRGRFELKWRQAMRRATRGYVSPSLAVSPEDLGTRRPAQALPLRRLVVMERSDLTEKLEFRSIDRDSVVERARLLLTSQRERLSAIARTDAEWRGRLAAVSRAEVDLIRRGIADVPGERLVIPGHWDASHAVAQVARALGIEP